MSASKSSFDHSILQNPLSKSCTTSTISASMTPTSAGTKGQQPPADELLPAASAMVAARRNKRCKQASIDAQQGRALSVNVHRPICIQKIHQVKKLHLM